MESVPASRARGTDQREVARRTMRRKAGHPTLSRQYARSSQELSGFGSLLAAEARGSAANLQARVVTATAGFSPVTDSTITWRWHLFESRSAQSTATRWLAASIVKAWSAPRPSDSSSLGNL